MSARIALFFVPSNTTQSSELDISGATNDILGSGGQQVCKVCIELEHDAIDEIDMILIAPDGSSVELISETGLSSGQDLLFEICFVSCDQPADPDSGHAAVFDSSEDWGSNANYDGTYYPSMGCLEDLTGEVNGEWEIEITDFVGLDDGTLLDWYIVFADDAGLNCANADECDININCLAEGGELNQSPLLACEGDSELNVDIEPSFPGNNEPPMPDFDYSWIIVNADTDVIEDISSSSDLTSYPPGSYLICGLSYLVNDEPLIPTPDGSLTVDDIDDDIDDEEYCADLSNDCMEITIDPVVTEPDFDGPTEVCPDEISTYTILDYDPSILYLVTFTGDVSSFSGNDDTYEIAWTSGPAQICAVIESACGDVETCIEVDIIESPEDIEIIGELEPCPGRIETYTFEPEAGSGESYDVTVSGGTIVDQSDSSVQIEWPDQEDTYEICIELTGGLCPGIPVCEEVEVEGFDMPDELDSPEVLCEGDVGFSEIDDDDSIIEYIWTVTNLDIIDGQNTETLEYSSSEIGTSTVCLELITECGPQGPICEDIEILAIPEPIIEEVDPSCDLTFTLISNADPNNDLNWELENGPGDADIEDPSEPITEVTVTEPGLYQFQLDEVNDACSESEQIAVEVLAELELSDPIFECNLDNQYTVTFTILNGEAPYTVNGEQISGSSFTSDFIDSEEAFEFEVSDDLSCATFIEDDFECPCVSDAGNMSPDVILLCIQDEITFEALWLQDGLLDNNDVGMFFVHDEDDDELGDILDSNTSGIFEYNDNYELGIEYYISFVVGNDDGSGMVDLDDDCLSVAFGQPIIFYDLPQVNFEFDPNTCDSSITIDGDWDDDEISINWSKAQGPGSVFFSTTSGLPTIVEVNERGTYIIEAELDNVACTNIIELEIEFTEDPVIGNISESCNSAADFYTVSFEVIEGDAPFTASFPGTFNGNIFTSDPIPTGQDYSIFITDNNGCNSLLATGSKLCDCISDSGFMVSDLISQCVTKDSITVNDVVDSVLDADDIGLYYLHTSSTNSLGDVKIISANTTFGYTPDIVLDSIYYVSFVVGNNVNNTIDISDPCLDVSNTQPIMWTSIPLAEAGPNQSTCDGNITLSASPANGSWSIVSAPNNSTLSSFQSANPDAEILLDSVGTYELKWEVTNGNCTASDTIVLIKNSIPSIINLNTECSADLLTYDASFEIVDLSSQFTVNGMVSNSDFIATALDVQETTEFLIINEWGCTTSIQVGPVNCECQSDAGTILSSEQNLCGFESIDVNISNGDYVLEGGDIIAYILHDGTANSIGNIIAISYGEEIPFDNVNMIYNTTYFLTVAIANNIGGSIDLDDICLQISEGQPIMFTEEINVDINDNLEGCIGDQVNFVVNSNLYPIDITLINTQGDIISMQIENSSTEVSVEINSDVESWSIETVNNECVNDLTGSVNVAGQQPTTFELVEEFEICNNPLFGSTINVNDLFTSNVPTGEWQSNNLTINGDLIDFADLPPGNYTLSYSNIGFDNLCSGMSDEITITVIDCNCATFNNPDITICSNSPSIQLSSLDTQNLTGNWVIQNPNNLSDVPLIVNDLIQFTEEVEGVFQIVYNINDPNYPDVCDQETSFSLTVEKPLRAGAQVSIPVLCNDETSTLNLFDYLTDFDLGGSWTFNNNTLTSEFISISDMQIGENVFTYTHEETENCQSSFVDVLINLEEVPIVEVLSNNVLCFGSDDGDLEIIIENPNGETVECYLNDVIQEDGKAITNLAPGDYNVYVRRGDCISETTVVTITEPEVVTVELGPDRDIKINSELTIQAIINILDSDIGSITWEDLSGILEIDELELTAIFESNNTISIQITDENGCIASDVINIRVREPEIIIEDIYIPNIISPLTQDNNTAFQIQNTEQVTMVNKFYIFDRWGNKVYAQEELLPDNSNLSWDGYFNNQLAQQGVYVYLIEVTYIDGNQEIFAGDLTLIR